LSISKKIRFDVFKRDGFQCQYCGKTPPNIVLEVDHIKPKKRNGRDDIENLITACFDCNRGKGADELRVAPPQTEDKIKILKEKEDQLKEYHRLQERIHKQIQRDIEYIDGKFREFSNNKLQLSDYGKVQIRNLLRHFSKHHIEDALAISWGKDYVPNDDKLKYACGVLWGKRKRGEI